MLTRRNFIATAAAFPTVSYLTMTAALAATPKDILVVAQQLDNMTTLDPHVSFEAVGSEICGNMYQKLVRPSLENADEVLPEIAESWQADAEGKTFTFKIAKGQKFASGGPLTAHDCAWSLQRVVTLNKSPAFIITQFGFTPENVAQRVRATDDETLVITTEQPTAIGFLLYCLSANVGSVVEKAVVSKQAEGDDWGSAWLDKNSAGSGAFVLQVWRPSDTITLNVNPNGAYEGSLKRIILRHIIDPSAQQLMLSKGDVDIARNLTTEQITSLGDNPDVKMLREKQASLMLLSMNVANETLSDPKVWEAVKWAINYTSIQKNILSGTHDIHQSIIPEGLPGADTEMYFHQDIDKAKALLAEAGLPDGFEITFDHYSAQPYPDVAQAIQSDLAKAGIKANLISGENRQVLTKMRAREHQMILSAWGTDYFDPNANADAFCINTDNSPDADVKSFAWRSSFKDDKIIEMAVAARDERDEAKRIEMYIALQKYFAHNSPFAIMMQKTTTAACRLNVEGVALAPLPDGNTYAETTKA
ncbi:ABC transporter substrate-binding protein [Rhodobacteraceae bacterium]|nr:ABC transporter substrate-binding protein [Paracoccaceae bacterium]